MAEPALRVEGLRIRLDGAASDLVDGVDLSVAPGETLCVVGESGCGKSLTALAVMGLLPGAPLRHAGGRAMLGARDLFALAPRAFARLRGDRIAMIFQEPMTALNPAFTIGDQIAEAVRPATAADPRARALELLRRVRVPDPERRLAAFPHQLSGGLRQRAMIAMALANDPAVLIADEPTTALDVTIQAQILDLLRDLQRERGMGLLLITHDLGVVAEMASRVAVMYAGRVVESGPVAAVFSDPQHPYTLGLMASTPGLAGDAPLAAIPGLVPAADAMPPGCRFAPRCAFAGPDCATAPPLADIAAGHAVACWRAPLEDRAAA